MSGTTTTRAVDPARRPPSWTKLLRAAIAAARRSSRPKATAPPIRALNSLATWAAAGTPAHGDRWELVVLAVVPVGSGPDPQITPEVQNETFRRIGEVMRSAETLDVGWSGEWAFGQENHRSVVVHRRRVSLSPEAGLTASGPTAAGIAAARLAESVDRALAVPYRTGSETRRLLYTAGYTYSGVATDARTVPTLIQDAILAAEQARPSRPLAFDGATRVAAHRRVRMAAALQDALRDGSGLSVVFEPIVDVRTGRPIGAETLARWRTPEWGAVDPVEFVPIAERTSAILDLGEFVLTAACRAASAEFIQRQVTVNLSAVELAHPDLEERVRRALQEYRIDPSMLVLEIKESVPEDILAAAGGRLRALADQGVRLSLDNFGSNGSGLSRMVALPWWSVKLARTLIGSLRTIDSPDAALVRAVVGLAHDLGQQVVAEGVETAQQLRLITELRCDHAQGWVFGHSRPTLAQAWADQQPPGVRFPGVIPLQH